MKSKLNKVFFVTYNDYNKKSPIMVFDNSLTDDKIKELILQWFRDDDDIVELYDDDIIVKATEVIVSGHDSWSFDTEDYYIEDVTEYYL